MDALDSRKPSDATAYDSTYPIDGENKAIQQQISRAPAAVKEALEIVSAGDVPRSEILRVRNAAFAAAVAAAPLNPRSKESRQMYFFCFITLCVDLPVATG